MSQCFLSSPLSSSVSFLHPSYSFLSPLAPSPLLRHPFLRFLLFFSLLWASFIHPECGGVRVSVSSPSAVVRCRRLTCVGRWAPCVQLERGLSSEPEALSRRSRGAAPSSWIITVLRVVTWSVRESKWKRRGQRQRGGWASQRLLFIVWDRFTKARRAFNMCTQTYIWHMFIKIHKHNDKGIYAHYAHCTIQRHINRKRT